MPFDSTVWSVCFWVFGLTLGLALRVLIFQASWALSGLEDPPFSRVVATVSPLWVVVFIGGLFLDWYAFRPLGVGAFGWYRIGGVVAISLLASLVDFPVYLSVFRPGIGRGVWIALFEFVLTLLSALLVAGLIFVCVAVNQFAGGGHVGAAPTLPPLAFARTQDGV